MATAMMAVMFGVLIFGIVSILAHMVLTWGMSCLGQQCGMSSDRNSFSHIDGKVLAPPLVGQTQEL